MAQAACDLVHDLACDLAWQQIQDVEVVDAEVVAAAAVEAVGVAN